MISQDTDKKRAIKKQVSVDVIQKPTSRNIIRKQVTVDVVEQLGSADKVEPLTGGGEGVGKLAGGDAVEKQKGSNLTKKQLSVDFIQKSVSRDVLRKQASVDFGQKQGSRDVLRKQFSVDVLDKHQLIDKDDSQSIGEKCSLEAKCPEPTRVETLSRVESVKQLSRALSTTNEKSGTPGAEPRKLSRASSTCSEVPKYEEEAALADDQREELREAFNLFEKAGKGRINVRDLGALLRSLGMNPSERDLEEARHELEIAGTFSRARGTVSFADVERYVARRGGVFLGDDEEEDIHAAFQALDKNGNGRIDVDEFRHFMTTMGERMTSEEVEELLSAAKKDGVSFLEYKDIVRALQSGNT